MKKIMATIKSYTDIEQSKKLSEILPPKSADMRFCFSHELGGRVIGHYPMIGREPSSGTIPCWSLAALLGVLQYPALFQRTDQKWGCTVWVYTKQPYSISPKDSPIDACVAMIEKLHELNLL